MKTPQKEISERLNNLRAAMRRQKVGAAYIVSDSSVRYYSGFTGSDSALLVTSKKMFLLTDSRYTTEAEQSALAAEVVLWKKGIAFTAGELVRKSGIKKIGVEQNLISLSEAKTLKKESKAALVDFLSGITEPRQVKSDWEVKAIKKALRIAEASYTETMSKIKIGMRECDVALELEWQMRSRGAEGVAFPTIVAVGPNAALPHAHPEKRKVSGGKVLLIDWGARLDGYNSDLTRTVFIDSISPAWRTRYESVLRAQLIGIKEIAAGIPARDVDAAARSSLEGAGLGRFFTHSLGHSVGIDVHEGPSLSKRFEVALQAGNILTVEPGIYLPGYGGIRIEDMVLVTAKGRQVLSRLPKDLDNAVVAC